MRAGPARSNAKPKPETILVIAPNWIGDTVLAQSLLIALRRHQPATVIEVLAPPPVRPLVQRMPEVDRIIDPARGGWRLARRLRARGYNRAIILPNSFRSALVPFLARIPVRTGYARDGRRALLTDARPYDRARRTPQVEQFAALGAPPRAARSAPPPPTLCVDPARARASAERLGVSNARRPLLALCPGAAFGPAKRWPAEYYARVARAWRERRGGTVWLLGSSAERALSARINEQAGNGCVDLAGRTGLDVALDLLALTDAVVANDSGLLYAAAALGCRVVGLYGPTDPGFNAPLQAGAVTLWTRPPCGPCYSRVCPLGHQRCLRDLSPQSVIDWLDTMPARSVNSRTGPRPVEATQRTPRRQAAKNDQI